VPHHDLSCLFVVNWLDSSARLDHLDLPWLSLQHSSSKSFAGTSKPPSPSVIHAEDCRGMLMTFGSVFTYYAKHLLAHISTLKLCLVGSIPPFLALFCSIIWGRLLDSGYHLPINAIGGALSTAGLVALMFTGGNGTYRAGSYIGTLLSMIPIGLGQSCYFVTFSHVAKTWFPQCKGLAIGIGASGAALGEKDRLTLARRALTERCRRRYHAYTLQILDLSFRL
jgi:hypothetical protein